MGRKDGSAVADFSVAATLTDLLRVRLAEGPDEAAVTLIEPDREDRTWTRRQLLADAQQFGDKLLASGVEPGQVVPIILPTSADLIVSYWACQLIGAIPSVLAFPTSKIDPKRYYQALPKMLAHSGVRTVLTYEALAGTLRALKGPAGQTWSVLVMQAEASESWPEPQRFYRGEASDVAVLQHSSGTTGLQKGVALRHGDVIRQIAMLETVAK